MPKKTHTLLEVDRYRFACTACWRSVFIELIEDYTGLVTQVRTAHERLPEICPHCGKSENFRMKTWSTYVKKVKL